MRHLLTRLLASISFWAFWAFWSFLVPWVGLAQAAPGELRLYIWTEYIDPEIINSFERKTGLRVKTSYYDSAEELEAALQKGGKYDVVVPPDSSVPELIRKNLLQPLDQDKINRLGNLDTQFFSPPFDPGNRYTVAYQWGTVGLLYRRDLFTSPPQSWSVLFEPGQNKTNFVLLDSLREMLGITLLYLGKSANSRSPEDLNAAASLLTRARQNPRFKGLLEGVPSKDAVVSGKATAGIVYNGDALRAIEENRNLAFTIPYEGSILFVDSMAIPKNAPNPDAANRFINYILDARIGAQLSNFNQYATPNQAALRLINRADLLNTTIYPNLQVRAQLQFIQDLGRDTSLYSNAWKNISTKP
jgi:spermidine/putrescine transport system substrate-binding protein